MIFLTYWFALFAAVFLVTYWLPMPPTLRRLVLLTSCLTFHWHFAGPAGMAPIVLLATMTYLVGRIRGRAAPTIGIVINILALIFYKYALFLTKDVIGLFSG